MYFHKKINNKNEENGNLGRIKYGEVYFIDPEHLQIIKIQDSTA